MSDERSPLSDGELEALSERLAAKLLPRLIEALTTARAQPVRPPPEDLEPTLEDYIELRARRRKRSAKAATKPKRVQPTPQDFAALNAHRKRLGR